MCLSVCLPVCERACLRTGVCAKLMTTSGVEKVVKMLLVVLTRCAACWSPILINNVLVAAGILHQLHYGYLPTYPNSVMLKEKGCICFVDPEKAYDRVPRKVLEWAMRKKGIPEALVRSVMSLSEGAKTRVRFDFELSEEFEVKMGMHQGSVLSPWL